MRRLCNHCERVNIFPKRPEYEWQLRCEFCDAACWDLFPWGRIARENGYPLKPNHGEHYPLYRVTAESTGNRATGGQRPAAEVNSSSKA